MTKELLVVLIGVGGVLLLGILVLVARTWRQVHQGQAMIVNKMGSEPKVTFTGAIVLPIVNKAEVMDLSVKTIEVARKGKEGLICADNIRADIKVTFFVSINKTVDDVLRVAQTIGCVRASQQSTLEELFSAKFSEALKTVGKNMEFEQLYTQRQDFKNNIKKVIGEDLNGYVLDDCAIDYLEQTPIEMLDPNNVLDALGIRKITDITTAAAIDTNQLKQKQKMEIGKQDLTAQGGDVSLRAGGGRGRGEEEQGSRGRAGAPSRRTRRSASPSRKRSGRTSSARRPRSSSRWPSRPSCARSRSPSRAGSARSRSRRCAWRRRTISKEVGRNRKVSLNQIDMNKAVETEKRSIAGTSSGRASPSTRRSPSRRRPSRTSAWTPRSKAQEERHHRHGRGRGAGRVHQGHQAGRGRSSRSPTAHAKKQIILADAAMEASDKEARAAIRRSEGAQAEAAAEGLAPVRVEEADALAIEKGGLAEVARPRHAQVAVTDREGTVIAENVRRKLMAEAQGHEAEAAAIEKTGLANAVSLREKLLAEVTAKGAEADVIKSRMLAEATGLSEKAKAMQQLTGGAREHEEYRLRLDTERVVALEQIKARVLMAEQQAKVLGETMGHADIKIVGGDGQFFDKFVRAVSLGSSIDGIFESSEVVRKAVGDKLLTTSHKSPTETLSGGVLGNLKIKADDGTKAKLKQLLDQAKQLGVQDRTE